jgi:DNA (cytosine-5)-methyltransferase 1
MQSGSHQNLVAAFLTKYYGSDQDPRLEEPLHTVTTRDRFGLVTLEIGGEPWVIVDIGMRMLTPRELFLAQGFPAGYEIERGPGGVALTKSQQVACAGNSVPPPVVAAIIRANCAPSIMMRVAA